ncbi:MAG: fumarylacetoacetate hydrolase [Verrucomicrobia bacterium]|nr:MAG: fumarylacetoacetate hydrolase [Verrucomicrobiota bacterium]
MKLCRFNTLGGRPRLGLVRGEYVLDLGAGWISGLAGALNSERIGDMEQMASQVVAMAGADLPSFGISEVQLLAPVDSQEVWAAGVTYLHSKKARMEESDFSATAYDKVYDAERPELFFKSLPEKVVGPGEPVGIRKDARWNVPEPELALVINSRGKIVGYTIGNDMSSRDIEGENLLYLPQAKVYHRSCALGPWIVVGPSEGEARNWKIQLQIRRNGQSVFESETSVGQIKRPFEELVAFLFRSQSFPHGAVLLTGTGIVPPDSFTLQPHDTVRISISGIGTLENPVVEV